MTDDKPKITLEFNITSPLWKNVKFDIKRLCRKITPLVLEEARKKGDVSLSMLLCGDDEIRALNKQFRKKDKPTNTLSFPSGDKSYLGDIAISYETTDNEAIEQGKTLKSHFTHLYIHSLLHLLGHDHVNEDDAKVMESKEIKILKQLKINNPYIL